MPDKISSHMSYIVTHEYFESVSTDDTKEDGYCIVKFTSDPYTVQEGIIIYERIIKMAKQLSNYCYLFFFKGHKWYAEPLDGKLQNSIVATTTVIHTKLDIDITYDLSKYQFTYVVRKCQDYCIRRTCFFLLVMIVV